MGTKTHEIEGKLESLHGPAFTLAKYVIKDTTYLASGGEGVIELWNLSASKHIATLKAHDGYIGVLETFNDNETPYVASGSKDSLIKIWNLNTNSLHRILKGHKSFVFTIAAFKDHGVTYLATGGYEESIKLWDFNDGKVELITKAHTSYINKVLAFEINGHSLLASGSGDGTIRVWNTRQRRLLATFVGHKGLVTAFKLFHHNNSLGLVSGDSRGIVRFWDLEKFVAIGEALVGEKMVNSITSYYCDGKPVLIIGGFRNISLYTGRDTEHVTRTEKTDNMIDYYASARRPSELSITVSRKFKRKEDESYDQGDDLDEIISLATQMSVLTCDQPNRLGN